MLMYGLLLALFFWLITGLRHDCDVLVVAALCFDVGWTSAVLNSFCNNAILGQAVQAGMLQDTIALARLAIAVPVTTMHVLHRIPQARVREGA